MGVLQAQVGDIGIMGGPAKLDGKAVEGVRLFKGGTVGENPNLATEFESKIPADESVLLPRLRDLLIADFGATLKAGYVLQLPLPLTLFHTFAMLHQVLYCM